MNLQESIDRAKEQQVVILHLGVPMGIFKILNALAAKEKKNFATFIGDTLREKAEQVAAKHESLEQKGSNNG